MAICYMKYKLERTLRLVQPSRLTSTCVQTDWIFLHRGEVQPSRVV